MKMRVIVQDEVDGKKVYTYLVSTSPEVKQEEGVSPPAGQLRIEVLEALRLAHQQLAIRG